MHDYRLDSDPSHLLEIEERKERERAIKAGQKRFKKNVKKMIAHSAGFVVETVKQKNCSTVFYIEEFEDYHND